MSMYNYRYRHGEPMDQTRAFVLIRDALADAAVVMHPESIAYAMGYAEFILEQHKAYTKKRQEEELQAAARTFRKYEPKSERENWAHGLAWTFCEMVFDKARPLCGADAGTQSTRLVSRKEWNRMTPDERVGCQVHTHGVSPEEWERVSPLECPEGGVETQLGLDSSMAAAGQVCVEATPENVQALCEALHGPLVPPGRTTLSQSATTSVIKRAASSRLSGLHESVVPTHIREQEKAAEQAAAAQEAARTLDPRSEAQYAADLHRGDEVVYAAKLGELLSVIQCLPENFSPTPSVEVSDKLGEILEALHRKRWV